MDKPYTQRILNMIYESLNLPVPSQLPDHIEVRDGVEIKHPCKGWPECELCEDERHQAFKEIDRG